MENLGNTFAESRLRNWNTCVLSTTQIKYRTTRSKESLKFENIIIEKVSSREKKAKKFFLVWQQIQHIWKKTKKKKFERPDSFFIHQRDLQTSEYVYYLSKSFANLYLRFSREFTVWILVYG